jgi:hypothetical protein
LTIVMLQGEINRFNSGLVLGTIRSLVKPPDGVSALNPKFLFKGLDEGRKQIKKHRLGSTDHPINLWVNQRRKDEWSMTILLSLRIDSRDRGVGLIERINKGQANMTKGQALKLGQDRLAEGLGRDARSI